jgi:transaldolase
MTMTRPLAELTNKGVSIWLDDLSRQRLTTGSLAGLVARDHVTGGVEGRVSIEVDPRLAYDTETTIAEARFLWWLVDRPNLFIKIPAARRGLSAIAACLAEGISINVTLIFSLARYDEVTGAFLHGLERARQAGRDLASIASVASFFASRVDTEVDARLDKIGTPAAAALRGQAAIANARQVLSELRALGIDYGDVTQVLEDNGLAAFDANWRELGDQLAAQLKGPTLEERRA